MHRYLFYGLSHFLSNLKLSKFEGRVNTLLLSTRLLLLLVLLSVGGAADGSGNDQANESKSHGSSDPLQGSEDQEIKCAQKISWKKLIQVSIFQVGDLPKTYDGQLVYSKVYLNPQLLRRT